MAGYTIDLDLLAGSTGQNAPPLIGVPAGALAGHDIVYGGVTATRGAKTVAAPAGYLISDWQSDYFDRIRISIDNPNFGTVAGPVQRTLTIENKFSVAKSVSAQAVVGASGVSILSFPALPFDLLPSEVRTWTLEASSAGDPVIDGHLEFTIGGTDIESVGIRGIRAIIFPFIANWREAPIDVGRIYPDSISGSIALGEERHGFGDIPNLSIRFVVKPLDADESSALARTLEKARALPVAVPVWSDFVRISSTAAAAATSIAVTSTTNRKFSTARPFVLIWSDWDHYAVVEISSVGANALGLVLPLLAEWPAEAWVIPLRFGRLRLDSGQRQITDRIRRFPVDFAETPL